MAVGGWGIRKSVQKDDQMRCIKRGCCIHYKIDNAAMEYLKEHPDVSFSKLVCAGLRDKLIKEGYYKT